MSKLGLDNPAIDDKTSSINLTNENEIISRQFSQMIRQIADNSHIGLTYKQKFDSQDIHGW